MAKLVPTPTLVPSALLTPGEKQVIVPPGQPVYVPPPLNGLYNGQYELDGEIIWGTRTPWAVPNDFLVEGFGMEEGELLSNDYNLPQEDGTSFGIDTYGGMNVFWRINLWRKGQPALDDLSRLQSAWKSAKRRNAHGEVSTLRIAKQGRVRRIFGRARKFVPEYGSVELGWAPIDCDFKCVDSNFYSDEQNVMEMELANPSTGGVRMPFTTPLRTSTSMPAYGAFTIGGDKETWPQFMIRGPIINPTVEVLNQFSFSLNVALAHDEIITVDPRPWRRMTLLNMTYNRAGRYTSTSATMREMQLEPGNHFVTFTGLDVSLSSKLAVLWRDAYSTP